MKAFIFDMDGVIVDTQSVHTDALAEVFARHGVEVSRRELDSFAGTKRGTAFRTVAEARGLALPVEEMCREKDEVFAAMIDAMELFPIDGIVELLASLRARRVGTAIASSSSAAFISLVVDRLGIRGYFDALVSGQGLAASKPDPAVYLLAAKELGAEPEECVALEDAANGVAAAKAAGMYCIGYQNESSGEQDLSAADLVVKSIRDIPLARL